MIAATLTLLLALPSGWTEVPAPDAGAVLRECAKKQSAYDVSIAGGELSIAPRSTDPRPVAMPAKLADWVRQQHKARKKVGNIAVVPLDEGFLWMQDRGGDGGRVSWTVKRLHRSVAVFEGTPFALFRTSQGIFAIERAPRGAIRKIGPGPDGKLRVNESWLLPGPALAAGPGDDGEVLVVTTVGVVTMRAEAIERIGAGSFEGLGVGSVVRHGGDVYVGMRHAVARVAPSGTTTWILPPDASARCPETR